MKRRFTASMSLAVAVTVAAMLGSAPPVTLAVTPQQPTNDNDTIGGRHHDPGTRTFTIYANPAQRQREAAIASELNSFPFTGTTPAPDDVTSPPAAVRLNLARLSPAQRAIVDQLRVTYTGNARPYSPTVLATLKALKGRGVLEYQRDGDTLLYSATPAMVASLDMP